MIKLNHLKPNANARKRKKFVGRGLGSGHGTYSGVGAKGQNARSGGGVRPGFEGGRQPLIRQVPKSRGKGFRGNPIKVEEIKLSALAAHFADNETVSPETLKERGLVDDIRRIKILNTGDLAGRKLIISNVQVTAGAKAIITKAGGKIEEIVEETKAE